MRCCSVRGLTAVFLAVFVLGCFTVAAAAPGRTSAKILEQSTASDWRALAPDDTLVIDLAAGQVIIELAPKFAPRHVENIRALAKGGYYAKSAVVRVQDNYVVQWADPAADDAKKAMPLGAARTKLPAELTVDTQGLPLSALPDTDEWAKTTGFVDGLPVAVDATTHRAWITHCYGVVGSSRDNTIDSTNASSLYAVIGQSPRRLDLNITVVGRVVKGMDLLASLPRGTGPLGFYEKPSQHVPFVRARLLSDIPVAERPRLEVLRTDTKTWSAWIEAARNPPEEWFVRRHGHTNVCNVSLPTRAAAKP